MAGARFVAPSVGARKSLAQVGEAAPREARTNRAARAADVRLNFFMTMDFPVHLFSKSLWTAREIPTALP